MVTGKKDEVGEDNGNDKIDEFLFIKDIEELLARYLKSAKEEPFHLSMFHLRDPDTEGHAHGWDLRDDSPYLKALMRVDGVIGQLLNFIDS